MTHRLKRLANLIKNNQGQIVQQWKMRVASLPRTKHWDEPLLVDHMPDLLREISEALMAPPNLLMFEQPAHGPKKHGESRFALGFDVQEVVAEYNLLREILQQ